MSRTMSLIDALLFVAVLCGLLLNVNSYSHSDIQASVRVTVQDQCITKRNTCQNLNLPNGVPKTLSQSKIDCMICTIYCLEERDNLSIADADHYNVMGLNGETCKGIEEQFRIAEITELHNLCSASVIPQQSQPNPFMNSVAHCVRCVALIGEEMPFLQYPSSQYDEAKASSKRCSESWYFSCIWLREYLPFSNTQPAWTIVYNALCPQQVFGQNAQ